MQQRCLRVSEEEVYNTAKEGVGVSWEGPNKIRRAGKGFKRVRRSSEAAERASKAA